MNSSQDFTHALKNYFDTIARIVWESFSKGLRYDKEWPESEFFSSLVTQGFRGSDSRVRDVLDKMLLEKPYSIKFELVRHNQQCMEPLTGADLAFLFELKINHSTYRKKVFLVQLKKAVEKGGKIIFSDIHHKSGKTKFGVDLHQAEKMLLFSPCSVFWLAVPPSLIKDEKLFSYYNERNSFATRSKNRKNKNTNISTSSANLGSYTPFSLPMHPFDPELFEELEFMWHRYFRHYEKVFGPSSKSYFKEAKEKMDLDIRDNLIKNLRDDAAVESNNLHGIQTRMPILVAHAESILFYSAQTTKDLRIIYNDSIAFTEFFLGEVISDEFGDDNEELIDALLSPKPNDYIRRTVREFSGNQAGQLDDDPTRAIVRAQIDITTPAGRQG